MFETPETELIDLEESPALRTEQQAKEVEDLRKKLEATRRVASHWLDRLHRMENILQHHGLGHLIP